MDAMPIKTEEMTHRIGRFYTGRPSWRTQLRALRRRLGNASLPLSEEEQLIAARAHLVEDGAARGATPAARAATPPIHAVRMVHPLPRVLLAADGKTTFRYLRAPKNASTNTIHLLLEITGEAAYRRWSDEGHLFQTEESALRRFTSADGQQPFVTTNDNVIAIHYYMARELFSPEPHADIRFCVVRDPVERFVSGLNQFQTTFWRREGKMPTVTDTLIDTWLDTMTRFYETCGSLKGVTRGELMRKMQDFYARAAPALPPSHHKIWFRQSEFLGHDVGWYTHIFSLRRPGELHAFLSELAGKPLSSFSANSSRSREQMFHTRGLSLERPQLTAAQRRKVEAMYAEDYRVFGRWF